MVPERKKIDDLAGGWRIFFIALRRQHGLYGVAVWYLPAIWHPLLYGDQERALFRGRSNPCHLGKTAGGEIQYSTEYPSRILCLTHILTHTKNLPQNERATRRERSSPLVALCFYQSILLLPTVVKNTMISTLPKVAPHRCWPTPWPTRGNERTEHMEQRVFDLILFAVKTPAKPYIPTAGGYFITW